MDWKDNPQQKNEEIPPMASSGQEWAQNQPEKIPPSPYVYPSASPTPYSTNGYTGCSPQGQPMPTGKHTGSAVRVNGPGDYRPPMPAGGVDFRPSWPGYPPQAPGAPFYGQPPVNGIPLPVYTPPVDLARPLSVTGSRRMTFEQYKRLNKLGTGLPTAILTVALILTIGLGGAAIFLSYAYETAGFILTIVLAAVSEAAGILLAAWQAGWRRRALREAYACAEAAGNGDAIVELYPDRAQVVTMRGSSVVPFASAVLWEMEDMLALTGPGATIIWRAEDLTPEEGRLVYYLLAQRIHPSCRRIKGIFVPRAPYPLPLPVIRNDDEVKAVVKTIPPAVSMAKVIGAGLVRMLPLLIPLLTILGVYLAANYAITPSFTADIGLFVLICWGGGWLLATGTLVLAAFLRRDKRPPIAREVAYAITRDGVARRKAGGTVFVPHTFIRKRFNSSGAELKTPYGSDFIPWAAVPDPAALRSALEQETQPSAGYQ